MKRYELVYEIGEAGVFRMSTVASPATKTQLVMFESQEEDDLFVKMMIPHHEEALRMAEEYDGKVSEKLQLIINSILSGQKKEIEDMKSIISNEINMQFQDDEKRVIYSVAMRPNMLIPRSNINGEPALVHYSEETVRNLQQNFFKNNNHIGATINHNDEVNNGMYFFESWIVEDVANDKSNALGMSAQKGDWILGQKVEDPDIWAKIKNKELTGFSIEAYLEPKLINNSIEMNEEEIDNRIKKILMADKLGAEYDVDGVKYYAVSLEPSSVITDENGTPVPNVSIVIDGNTYETDENGKIKEVAIPEEETTETEDLQPEIDRLTVENADLKAKISELEAGKTAMSAEIEAAKKVAVEMSLEKMPKEPLKPYEQMTNAEKVKFNRGKL